MLFKSAGADRLHPIDRITKRSRTRRERSCVSRVPRVSAVSARRSASAVARAAVAQPSCSAVSIVVSICKHRAHRVTGHRTATAANRLSENSKRSRSTREHARTHSTRLRWQSRSRTLIALVLVTPNLAFRRRRFFQL